MGLARALLGRGEISEAASLLAGLREGQYAREAERLLPLTGFLSRPEIDEEQASSSEIRYRKAAAAFRASRYAEVLDHLLGRPSRGWDGRLAGEQLVGQQAEGEDVGFGGEGVVACLLGRDVERVRHKAEGADRGVGRVDGKEAAQIDDPSRSAASAHA